MNKSMNKINNSDVCEVYGEELYEGVTYKGPLDLYTLFNSEDKVKNFFRFFINTVELEVEKFIDEKISMIPVSLNKGTRNNYICTDLHLMVKVIAKIIGHYSLGDEEKFIEEHRIVSKGNSKQNAANCRGLTVTIFEMTYDLAYVSNGKYVAYSVPQVFENVKCAVQFATVMLKYESIVEFLADASLSDKILEQSKENNAEQVAFSNQKCNEYWLKPSAKNKKMYMYNLY